MAGQPHGKAQAPNREQTRKVSIKQSFIHPIAPMGPLFANEELFRVPWSSFGFHRGPARRHIQTAPAVTRNQLKPPPLSRTEFSASLASPATTLYSLSPRGHLLTERDATLPFLRRQSSDPIRESADLPTPGFIPSTDISPARAKEIQAALVRFGYLNAPTGSWDAASAAAMRRLQSDHHWQTKLAPDARALILLGLGPGNAAP